MQTMKAIVPLLARTVLLFLGTATVIAADSTPPQGDLPRTAADEKGKQREPAECPIKKTIDGKTYCFQNDPALTKPQGGS
jgi:hypothetical protein